MDTAVKHRFPRLRKYGWIIPVIVITMALAAWAAFSGATSSVKTERESVTIGEVIAASFDDYIHINAKVESGTTVQVSALETGIVEKKWVEEGAMVSSGDIILTLHNPILRQQILDSESQLAEKQNMLRDTEIAMEKERLQIKQDLLQASTSLNQKKRVFLQQASLFAEKLTSREEYLRAKEDYELSEANLRLLSDRQRQDSIYRTVQVEMMRESLRNMQENFLLVRQRADNLNVRASYSGQLGSMNAELGQNISSGQQVGQINILDKYKFVVLIDEHYIDRVAPGVEARVNGRNRSFGLKIAKVYPEVVDGKFRADLSITGETPENLRVGQSYPVDIILSEPEEAVVVSRGSFFQSSGGLWAYVLDADGKTARKREIKIGRQNPRFYEVLEGLEPGDKIIISSYSRFGDVDKVEISD